MASGRGGARPGAGRPKGSRSAATKDQIATISDMAKDHGKAALDALVQIATAGESEAARVSAANAILDRGFGKPAQTIDNTSSDGTMTPVSPVNLSNLSDKELKQLERLTDKAANPEGVGEA